MFSIAIYCSLFCSKHFLCFVSVVVLSVQLFPQWCADDACTCMIKTCFQMEFSYPEDVLSSLVSLFVSLQQSKRQKLNLLVEEAVLVEEDAAVVVVAVGLTGKHQTMWVLLETENFLAVLLNLEKEILENHQKGVVATEDHVDLFVVVAEVVIAMVMGLMEGSGLEGHMSAAMKLALGRLLY